MSTATMPESTPSQLEYITAVYHSIHCVQKNDDEFFRVLERRSGSVEIGWRVKRPLRRLTKYNGPLLFDCKRVVAPNLLRC